MKSRLGFLKAGTASHRKSLWWLIGCGEHVFVIYQRTVGRGTSVQVGVNGPFGGLHRNININSRSKNKLLLLVWSGWNQPSQTLTRRLVWLILSWNNIVWLQWIPLKTYMNWHEAACWKIPTVIQTSWKTRSLMNQRMYENGSNWELHACAGL